MEPKSVFEALARAIGLYFGVSALAALVSYALQADNVTFDQLVAPLITEAIGVFLLVRGDIVANWAFRIREDGAEK